MMTVTIEKLVFGGQGLGRTSDGQIVFVWNALPGETVEFEIIKKQKNYIETVATRILSPSPDRVEPKENHWLSSSPWQMISFEKENYWKQAIAAETYSKFGGLILRPENLDIASYPERQYGYRNKIEFSFVELPSGAISLAFFERGKRKHIPAEGSLLAEPCINETARHILAWVNEQKIPMRSLKTLIVRSDGRGRTVAALFLKDELPFREYPALTSALSGSHLYYSTHKSPASVPTKLLYSYGDSNLTATIRQMPLQFGFLSFFQINIPMFEQALADIARFLHPRMPVIDFYSGVGAVSLPFSRERESCLLVDNNEEAIRYANYNIQTNGLKNCEAICLPAEEITERIRSDATILLDPPRAGLHQKVIQKLLVKQPPRIIYLSCGIDTHARDLRLLSDAYAPSFLKLYNFFPRTPHIEGLAVLDRIS